MRIIGNDPSVPRQTQEVASGTLPNGKPVVVNADGTVSVVSSSSASQALGSPATYGPATVRDAVFDSTNNKVAILYSDRDNSSRPTVVIGTVTSGNAISFGTPVAVDTNQSDFQTIAFDSTNGKVVVAYASYGDNQHGYANVGTISGTSISFGSAVEFANSTISDVSSTFDSSNGKIVIVYRNNGNSSYGTAIVGTVSGTSISFGTAVVFESATSRDMDATFDTTNNKIVVVYEDNGNSNYGTGIVGTVSGTSISFGSPTTYTSARAQANNVVYDSANGKVVVSFGYDTSETGYAVVGTVSGTSISFGSIAQFNNAQSTYPRLVYDSTAERVVIPYRDGGNSGYGTLVVGTVSGTSITFSSEVVFESANSYYMVTAYDSNLGKTVISYTDDGNSLQGTGIVFQVGYTNNKLTSENYIGMSSGPASPAVSGTKVTFESGNVGGEHIGMLYDPDVGRIVIAYQDESNSFYGQAVVGTVSGTSISFGTPVVFESAKSKDFYVAYDTANDKAVIAFCDEADSDKGKGIVGTVSGTSISFGSEATFNSGATQVQGCVYDANAGKVVVVYRDQGNSNRGTAAVGTVSGTSISFGSEALFNGNNASYNIKAIYDSSAQKIVIAFMDGNNSSYGTGVVGTVSGTDITFGSATTFNSVTTQDTGIAYDSSNNKSVITYKDGTNSDKGMAVVGTVSGTSISFGTPVEFVSRVTGNHDPVYHSETGKIVINYISYTSSGIGKYITGTVSGTTIGSFSSPVSYYSDTNAVVRPSVVVDGGTNNLVFAWKENTGNTGSAAVASLESRGEVADGGHALIDTQGAISDNQGGLTAGQSYYVQNDGTLSTSADSPSVFAGTAVSATKLIVKG